MKYLVAYKPCGCVGAWTATPTRRWREASERNGLIVRDVADFDLDSMHNCSHGTVAAQLVAERAALAKWLNAKIAEAQRLGADAEAKGLWHAFHTYASSIAAWQEVLARVEGKPEGTANG